MKKHLSKKRVVLGALVVVMLAIASGVAYAYWTSAGTGSASATAGTSVAFTAALNGTAPTGLVPGGSDQAIDVKVTNPANFPQTLSALTVSVANATDGSPWTAVTGCSKDDFLITQPTVTAAPIAASPGSTIVTGAKIHMINSTTINQNGCKGVTIPLYFSAS